MKWCLYMTCHVYSDPRNCIVSAHSNQEVAGIRAELNLTLNSNFMTICMHRLVLKPPLLLTFKQSDDRKKHQTEYDNKCDHTAIRKT